jgi:hypothetical protein
VVIERGEHPVHPGKHPGVAAEQDLYRRVVGDLLGAGDRDPRAPPDARGVRQRGKPTGRLRHW